MYVGVCLYVLYVVHLKASIQSQCCLCSFFLCSGLIMIRLRIRLRQCSSDDDDNARDDDDDNRGERMIQSLSMIANDGIESETRDSQFFWGLWKYPFKDTK